MTISDIRFNKTDPTMGARGFDPNTAVDLGAFAKKRDHDALVQWASQRYDSIKSARSSIERQWYINLSFYFGKQYVQIVSTQSNANGNAYRLNVPAAPPWRVRMVANKIRPVIRTELSKVTASKPTSRIFPASNDDADIFAARAGEQIWDSIYRQKKVRNTLRRSMFWTLICGNGFIKDYWDAGRLDPNANVMGDIRIVPETPFHIMVPDFREEEIEDQPYLIHASTKSPEWVRANYGKLLNGRSINPNTAQATDILENSFVNLVGGSQLTKDSILCLEVWLKPGAHSLFPNGGMFTVLGDQVVQMEEDGWPYKHNEYPVSKFDHIPTGKFYSDSVITDMIPLQKEYNRTRSQIVEAKNRMSKPQLMAYKGSINPSQITTEPGQVILVTPGYSMPSPLPLQPLPNYVLEELQRCQADMDDVSGQHEITKGRVPPGVTAATAISYLQEQDDSKISHTVDSIEDGIEKIARHALSHVQQYWAQPRIVKVIGMDGEFDAKMFKGSDLRGNTDITVEAGSGLPVSKAAKQAYVLDLMKMGFVDPQDGLKVLEFGGVEKLYDEMQQDVRQAQRENLRLQEVTAEDIQAQMDAEAQGIPPTASVPVNTWDNHQIHIATHNKFRKSQAFDNMALEIKQNFEAHVHQHELYIQQEQMQQMMGGAPVAGAEAPADPNAEPGQPGPDANPANDPAMGGMV